MTLKNSFNIIYLVFISFFFVPNLLFSQEYKIQIFDAQTQKTIPYVKVEIENVNSKKKQVYFTNEQGELNIVSNLPFLIRTQSVSYKQFTDTVKTSSDEIKKFYLEQDVLNLEEFVVTATRTNVLLKDAPVITHVVTEKDIEKNGIGNVQTLLETVLPGIEFQRHGASQDIDIQGLGGRNILVLVDGERLAGETRGNIDYERINTSDIQKVEIIKGASSALYGSQAMGAVINIITKQRQQKVYAEVSAGYKSRSEHNFENTPPNDPHYQLKRNLDRNNIEHNILFGFNLKSWRAKTSVGMKNIDGFTLYDTDSLIKKYVDFDTIVYTPKNINPVGIEGSKQFSIAQKIEYQFNKKLSAQARISYYDRHKYDFYKEDKKHDYFNDIGYGVKILYNNLKNTTAEISFSSDIYNKYDYRERLARADLNYKDKFINPKLIVTHNWKKHQSLIGLEFYKENLLTDMFIYGDLIDKHTDTYTIFSQDEFKLNDKINIVTGFRGQYNTAFHFQFTPKISLMYSVKKLRIRTNYAMGYRAPGLKELYMNWNHLDMFTIQGNPDLKPEINHYVSLSAEYSKRNIRASVSVYNNYFKNKIGGQWFDNQMIYSYANISQANLTGCDVFAKIKQGNFIFSGSYGYVVENTKDQDIRLSVISPHTGNVQVGYLLHKNNYNLNINLGAKYIGAKHFFVQDELIIGQNTVDAYYPVDYKGYTILRFSIYQQFFNGVSLTAGIENLLNYKAPMVTFNSYAGTGRLFFIKINIQINKVYNEFFN